MSEGVGCHEKSEAVIASGADVLMLRDFVCSSTLVGSARRGLFLTQNVQA